jgi:ribosomal protein S18 acetylase RimI-like enzyme
MSPPFALRAADAADVPAVQRLAERVWRAHYPGILADAQIDYMLARGYATHVLLRFVHGPDAGLELALVDGGLAGFAAWLVLAGLAEVKLDKLYVDPVHQRTGIGRALADVVAAHGRRRGLATMVLNVNKNNVGAQAAYARQGFVRRDAVVVDIGEGFVMDDYVLARPL